MVKNDFETFYNNINHSKIGRGWQEINKQQTKRKKKAIGILLDIDIFVVVCLCIFCHDIILNVTLKEFFNIILLYALPLLIINIIAYQILTYKTHEEYSQLYKKEIIELLFNNFFDEVDYIPNKQMPSNIYNECKQYEMYDNYYSDDYMEGKIEDKYSIKMAEVTTEVERKEKNSEGEEKIETYCQFKGLFATIHITKTIEGQLVIKENNTIWKKDRLEMDSDEFEKLFDVSASDKIKGMQLLTHDIMDLLIDFRKQWDIPFDIVINNNIMYIRLHTGNMFESSYSNKKVINEAITKKYYNIVDFIYLLSKEMIKNVEQTQL